MPGSQPTVETPVRRWRDARRRAAARAASSTCVDVHQRLAHAHEHEVVDRLDAAEVQHLVEDLRGGQVAAEAHRPGRAERAGQRAARLRGDADRAAPVAVAHQHRLDGAAVGGVEERLDGAVARRAPRRRARASRTARARPSSRAQRRREVGHRLVAGRAARGPAPHLPGAEGGLAELGQRRVEQRQVHAPMVAAGAARPASPRRRGRAGPRRVRTQMRLAKYLAHAGVASRRAAEQLVFAGRVTVGGEVVRDPARDVGERRRGRGRRQAGGARAPARRLRAAQAGRLRQHGEGPAGPPDGRLARPQPRAAVPRRPARRRHDRPDPAHQRRRARPPPDAPVVRGAARLPRAGAQPAGARAGAARGCARAWSSRTAGRRRRACAGSRPTGSRSCIHEGRKRQVRRMCEAVGHRVVTARAGRLRPAAARRPPARRPPPARAPAEVEAAARAAPAEYAAARCA